MSMSTINLILLKGREMEISHRLRDDCVVLDISATRFEHPKTIVLKNHAAKLFNEGHYRLALNLENVEFLDSFGLAVVISLMKECKEHGGNLAIFGLNETISRLVDITRLDRVLEVWDNEEQAVYQVNATAKA